MTLTLKYFGMIAELLHTTEETVEVNLPVTVAELRKLKEIQYPALARTDYRIAVNQALTDDQFEIKTASEIAFLPPFAGG